MRPVTFSRLTDDVLALYGPSMRAHTTFLAMSQTLKELAAVATVRRSCDLTPANVARWIEAHPDRSAARTRSLLSNVRTICNFAVASGWLAVSPFAIRKLKDWVRPDARPRKPAPRHKTAAEIGRLLRLLDSEAAGGGWADGRLQALAYVYAYTGLRAQEALHILAANVDLAGRTFVLEPVDGWRPKTVRSARTIPITAPLAGVLALWTPRCGSRWLFPGKRLQSAWRGGPGYRPLDQIAAAAVRAGIGPMTIIGFRKSIGTHAKTAKLGQLNVAAILGHTNVATQAYYDEDKCESVRPALEAIAGFYGRTGT
jgi:integrase